MPAAARNPVRWRYGALEAARAFAFVCAVLLVFAMFRLALVLTIGQPPLQPPDFLPYLWTDFSQHLLAALVVALIVEPVRRLGPRDGPRRWVLVALTVVAGAAAAVVVRSLLLIHITGALPQHVWLAVHVMFVRFLVLAALIVVAAEFQRREVLSVEAMHAAEAERDLLEQQTLQTRLKTLEAQIEPHFLFNTLATLRRLYETDPTAGRATFDRLIRYLEFAVPSMRNGQPTLGREVELIEAFLDLQQVRMGRRLAYRVEVEPALRQLEVPPMMMLTLVENAIKHGLAPQREGGRIDVRARVEDDFLTVEVADTGRGFGTSTSGGGTGLANIRARLAAMFGSEAALTLEPREPHGMRASILLPARMAGAS